MKQARKSCVAPIALACALAFALVGPVKALADIRTNFDWYSGHESDAAYAIGTAGEMKALAALVNGTADVDEDGVADSPVSFEGKTITLTAGLPVNFLGESIEPIGTPDNPFQGTFDGTQRQVDNFSIVRTADSADGVSNLGLFGVVGEHGSLVGVSVGARSEITVVRGSDSTDYIENVGMVCGVCEGTMSACSNAGTLTVESAVVQQGADDFLCVRDVGGVAGQCVFDMTGCSNTGNVSVSETSSPVASYEHAQLVSRVGGVVGLLGDDERIGTFETHIYGDASKHGALSDCSNVGRVTVETPMLSSLDRFGVQQNAESVYVGGVVGYSQGSITGCSNGRAQSTEMASDGRNVGYVRAENGVMVGGVCGSLRGVLADNTNIAWADDGADGNDPLVLTDCVNYGDVYGRVTVGGIVGKASTYTSVAGCLNQVKRDYFGNQIGTYVVGTRWNKPGPAGIVGTANGEVSYCANFGTIASATWSDEDTRQMNTMDGYYVAGIVGMLTYFDDQAPSHGGVTTPISEVYSCYNAGSIVAGANMRQRGIVGENNGFTHDNVLVEGLVYADEMVYGDDEDESEASGSVGDNRLYTAAELRGDKAAEAIAFLNSNSEANGWERYWLVPSDATSDGANLGYPLLDTQNPWGDDAVLLTDASTSLVSDAPYTGGESVPSVAVKLDGVTLVENADYRVVPESGAVDPSEGGAYEATVVGLGRYQGTASSTVAYDIVSGDFAKCSITALAHTFDYDVQLPKAEEVTVRTPAGTVVDSAEYTFKLVDELGDEVEAPVDADIYRIVATPRADSKLFTGTVEGTYRIKPASFMREVKFDDVTISHLGKDYPWVDSKTAGESDNPSTTLAYTGVAVKPEVSAITYNGHTLELGKDYRIVYGNSNSDDGYPDDLDANNMGKAGGTSVGCVTVRYITGKETNFTSYANMFFNITDDGSQANLAYARYVVEGDQVSDGQPIEPVDIYLGQTKLTEGQDYEIAYSNNVEPGEASFTATGIGAFTGTLTGTFSIEEGQVYKLLYTFAGAGTAESPYEATVTGVEYLSSRDTFDLVIPESVESEGVEYAVVAIGDKAFGGSAASDFSGSTANESKLKIASVFVPATVRSIGARAFGTTSITMTQTPALAAVTFEPGSQLESIGYGAFSKCVNLASFAVGEHVAQIGDYAFSGCSALSELRFLTAEADMPSVEGSHVFSGCKGVVVRGFESAQAVKDLAEANGTSTAGANGGKEFTFEPLLSLAGASVSSVTDKTFTGSAICPNVAVTLDGVRLTADVDYTVSYKNNVNAGEATLTVSGAGSYGADIVRTFTIAPASIDRASFARIADQPFTGDPVNLVASLSLDGYDLEEGRDFSVSYADAQGNAMSAPSATGSYRLVVTGMGNMKDATYRTFNIVASSIAAADITPVGDKVYTGAPLEPALDVKVAGVPLVRDEDYVVAYADNAGVGQATATIFGLGGYSDEASVSFRVVAASLEDATVAGVTDVEATGVSVEFSPVVVVDGTELVPDVDYAVSYARVDEEQGAGSDLTAASVSGSGSSAVVSAQASGGLSEGNALVAASLTTAAQTALDSAPSEEGSYKLVVTGKGNYTGQAEADFSIVEAGSGPATPTDLAQAGASLSLDQVEFVYDGQAHTPAVHVELAGATLAEGVDYVVGYSSNVFTGTACATVHGIGSYTGSLSTPFTITPGRITGESIVAIAAMDYTGSQICPHPVVRVAERTLSEGVDYAVAYGSNTDVGEGTLSVSALGSNYAGAGTASFAIQGLDISGATVVLAYDKATYTGAAQTPAVSVTLGNRVLTSGIDYSVAYSNNTLPGTASVVATGMGAYAGSVAAAFDIEPARIAVPRAKTGLTYTGSSLVGVATGKGYTLSGNKAANAGTYTAKATLATGYLWSDGTSSPATISWRIAPASIAKAKVTLSKTSFAYTGKALKPTVKSVKLGSKTVAKTGYSTSIPQSKNVGTYTVKVTGKGNYTGTAKATYKVTAVAQKLVAKAKSPNVKASAVKKAKKAIKISQVVAVSGAKTKLTYAKVSGSSANLTVDKKTGKVWVKKGTKKGTYTLKLKVTAAKSTNFKSAQKTVKVKVRIK